MMFILTDLDIVTSNKHHKVKTNKSKYKQSAILQPWCVRFTDKTPIAANAV